MIPKKLSIEVLLDPRNLLLPTIGLHHMEGRFLHLLTLLKIKIPLDHNLHPQKFPHWNRRPLQSSSGPEMKRIHLDPSLCLHLTLVTSLVGLSYFHLTEFRHPLQVKSHLEMPGILIQLGHIQRT